MGITLDHECDCCKHCANLIWAEIRKLRQRVEKLEPLPLPISASSDHVAAQMKIIHASKTIDQEPA